MYKIELLDLLWIAIPALFVVFLYVKVVDDKFTPLFALFRMFLQLILIGYALDYIFNSKSALMTLLILFVMLISASIIALRTLSKENKHYLNP